MPRTRPHRTVEEIAASVRSMRSTRDSWLENTRAASAARAAESKRKTECAAMVGAVLRAEALLRSQPDAAVWLAMLERERRRARGEKP